MIKITDEQNQIMIDLTVSCYASYDSGDYNKAKELFVPLMDHVKEVCQAFVSNVNNSSTSPHSFNEDIYNDMVLLLWKKVVFAHKRFDLNESKSCSGWISGIYWGYYRNWRRKINKTKQEDTEVFQLIPCKRSTQVAYFDFDEAVSGLDDDSKTIVKSMIAGEKSKDRAELFGNSLSKQSIMDNRVRAKLERLKIG